MQAPLPRRALAVFLATLFSSLVGCGRPGQALAADGPPSESTPPPAAPDAAPLYARACATCHGADGAGREAMRKALDLGRARLSLTDVSSRARSDEDLALVIRDGRNRMPGFGQQLSAAQQAGLLAHVRKLQRAAAPPEAAAPREAAPPSSAGPDLPTAADALKSPPSRPRPEVAGGPEDLGTPWRLGQALYSRSCTLCHGAEGHGNDRMAPMLGTDPETLNLREGLLERNFYIALESGRGRMPSYRAQFTREDMRAILAYLSSPTPPSAR